MTYIRATNKLKEFKYNNVFRESGLAISGQNLIDFMNGDHMEIDDTQATNLINNGMAQEVWKPTP